MTTGNLKDVIKPPFATYDIVVYFGCGLFSLPLIFHYLIEPAGFRFPRFSFHIGLEFAQDAISVLSLLFSVYVLGHIIAYCSSLTIEKAIDLYFGKISSAIILSTWSESVDRPELRQAWRADRRAHAFRRGKLIQNSIRTLIVAPAVPLVLLVNFIGGFDYYRSRVPRRLVFQAREKLIAMGYGPAGLRDPWFKVLEHVIINNCPTATARMYNYLIIGGIFRSISFLFLVCIWFEIYFFIHYIFHGHYFVKALMSDGLSPYYHAATFVILYSVFGFCLASYMKFSRRYAEEAIFAFVLAKD
ncbi:MAG: hypothetical protein EON58_11695 [Alphaproteobacteria bacterium]|nr:MAG: hypothetical protein EON58_11695 [Alphaproteobacteria bacterium]